MLLFDKFAKCQNSHFFRIWVLQTFGKWCKGTCLTNAPVKWEPQFMSKLFAGTIHRGIFFLSCFRFWKFGLKRGMIGPWPKPQGACGPFDIWPPGGGISASSRDFVITWFHVKWANFVNFTWSRNENHVKSRDFHVKSSSRHFVISRDENFCEI